MATKKFLKEGIIEEAFPSLKFRVKIEDNKIILAHLAGKMRLHFIRVLPGDKVLVEIDSYDETKGRIVRRL